MNIIRPFFAQNIIPTDVLPGAAHWMGLTFKELLILLGAVSIVTLLVFLWAAYIRKGPGRRSHHHHSHSSSSGLSADSAGDTASEKRYRRKRRRRREHRPRNPTLAETGGLPPVRTEHPPEPLP